ncbi:MAG: hypothetical protein QF404_12930 [Planctomycetota bacterium]|jgi:hypothetical protein|nr:hypothetical protein [Planctomycetota bacterium]
MPQRSFEEEWADKVSRVRASRFWKQVSSPRPGRIIPSGRKPRRNEVSLDSTWSLDVEGDLTSDGPARKGLHDLRGFLKRRFGLALRSRPTSDGPVLTFRLRPGVQPTDRWDATFTLDVARDRIRVTAGSEAALLRASLYLSNTWSLKRGLVLPVGRRTVRPAVPLHIGADLWGGFCTTQAWIHGREHDENFLELARMGVNGVPVMVVLEDYLGDDLPKPFQSLVNPDARKNRARLARLARQAAAHGVHVFCMGYNPKLEPDHPVFSTYPGCKGALQAQGNYRTLCTSDRKTRRFLADAWASLFTEIPELGGVIAISGGEGFYHCFMRTQNRAADCPRCGRRNPSHVVAELVNDIARSIRRANPEARLVTWPYSAYHWSGDRDQVEFIARLDPEHVIFQTEIDKDSVDWREAGYAKNVWDYSMSRITVSDRCKNQRRLCRDKSQPFSVKIECNNSIECLNVPYLPALENQRAIWTNARGLRPDAVHSRWMFDGSCKSPSEELGYWTLWGKGTEFDDPDRVLTAIATRDFGDKAAPTVRKAWRSFSEGLRHHPKLEYYVGSYFIGPAQPLVLDPVPKIGPVDPAFFGVFYWHWELSASGDDTKLVEKSKLFFSRPGFEALARRGPNRGRDVALDELRAMADLWERGARELDRAKAVVPASCQPRFKQEYVLGHHLAYTWRSAANVEEFLRLRDTIYAFRSQPWVRSGHLRENLRDLARMREIACDELAIARKDLALVKNVDFLDLSLRLDMGTESTETILKAKVRQIQDLLKHGLPQLERELRTW